MSTPPSLGDVAVLVLEALAGRPVTFEVPRLNRPKSADNTSTSVELEADGRGALEAVDAVCLGFVATTAAAPADCEDELEDDDAAAGLAVVMAGRRGTAVIDPVAEEDV